MKELNKTAAWLLTALRVVIGWHFLYEGIAKAFNPNWSSALYLMESKWLFSGFFHWLISSDTSLQIVDFLNIWGLILIGTCLFLGFLPHLASIAGALLLMLYYIANPPFVYSSVPSQSHFYIINYNLIEAVVLVVITTLREEQLYGLQRYLASRKKELIEKKFPSAENHEILETVDTSRREMIKNLAVVPLFGAVFFGMARKRGWISFEEDALNAKPQAVSGASLLLGKTMSVKELKGKVPAGKIKNAELSRIMIGGNLISGFAHARDLIYVSTWLKKYFTDEKVIETLWLCEACGINTAIFRCDENTIRIMEKYWSRGGKVQWLAQTYPKGEDLSNVKQAIDHGAMGAFVMGGIADKIIVDNKIDDLRKPIEYIQNQGLIAGTAAHSMRVLETCVANGIKPDFYMKTFHSHKYWSATPIDPANPDLPVDGEDHNMAHDNIWCMSDKAVTDFFSKDETPWIAYKVFAAGAIKPEEGLKHAFNSGADFACVGMFDFQVVENANLAYSILNGQMSRERKWYG